MLSITTNTFSCDYCGKPYNRKSSYDRHIILCEIRHKPKRLKICEEQESTDIPSVQQLYAIIQELAFKQQKMEEKMEEMQQWIDKKKQKLNIVQWLNAQFTPKLFIDRIKSLIVDEDDILYFIEQTFVQTVINILKKNLKTPEGGKIVEPISCFVEKSNVFYVYKTCTILLEEKEINTWIRMSPEDFICLLRFMHSKILNAICNWRDKNSEKIRSSEKMSETYNKTVHKLMSVDCSQECTLSKIRAAFYIYLKGDLKNMIDYEFEF